MASKFREHIDTSVAPSFSYRNVSLEDILRETRERSGSQSSGGGSGSTSPTDPSSQTNLSNASPRRSATQSSPERTRRRFTLIKK